MIIRVDYLIYVYISLCVCMLAFNLFYMGKSRWLVKHSPRKIARWEDFVSAAAERGGEVSTKASLIRKLSRPQQLILFHEAVQNLLLDEKKRGSVIQWFRDNREIFISLGSKYLKKTPMEQSFYAYFVGIHHLCGRSVEDAFTSQMLRLVIQPSIYCRENALYALYASKEPKSVVKAYILMNRHEIGHSRKLVTDGLLDFAGDKAVLAEELWQNWEKFSPDYQVAFIDFIRMVSGEFGECFLPILESDAEREVKFAVLRYYRKYCYYNAGKILRNYIVNWHRDDWEFAAISASALENYPGEKTVRALIHGISSENWYVRDNASDSLIKITDGKRLREILDEIQDSYGRDMLIYKIESRGEMKEEEEGNSAYGCS